MTEGLMELVRPMLKRHEGVRTRIYNDSLGIPTIGVGFNMRRADARELCAKCGADFDALWNGKAELTVEQVDYLLTACILEVLEWLSNLFPAFSVYSLNRQAALADMGFNLGEHRFLAFRKMVAAITAGAWQTAAMESQDSDWATEVGERAVEDAALLAGG